VTVALPTFSRSLKPANLPRGTVDALYVHVPFCFHKCHYCDFYSITHQPAQRMENFVELILREARMWENRVQPRTIFFGGGTPTLLPLPAMEKLLYGLRGIFDFDELREFTVEANPATVSAEYLGILRSNGVDRVSFGGQSFNRNELKFLERHHDPDDVPVSVELARAAGFTRINLDLIYAIPGQTMASWDDSLSHAMQLKTPHVSCYALTYEPNTPLAVRKRLGGFRAADDAMEIEMMQHARARLAEHNLHAYEISNYAIVGEECQHNLVYWTGGDYIGLGPSAASHVHGTRWKNRPHLGEWEQGITSRELPATDVEHLTPRQRAGELAMLLLRLSRGLNFDDFSVRSGLDAREIFSDQIDRLATHQLISLDDRGFRLSEKGLPLADAVAAEFLDVSI
jgi:oxygen-independent coproporphyrinogen-3 oxidase